MKCCTNCKQNNVDYVDVNKRLINKINKPIFGFHYSLLMVLETTQIASPIGSRSGFRWVNPLYTLRTKSGFFMGFAWVEWVNPNPCKSHRPTVNHAKPMQDFTIGSLSGYLVHVAQIFGAL